MPSCSVGDDMGQSSDEGRVWTKFRERLSGREVEAAPSTGGWVVRDGVSARFMDADDFERRYEEA
jgi:hypothetical protein